MSLWFAEFGYQLFTWFAGNERIKESGFQCITSGFESQILYDYVGGQLNDFWYPNPFVE